MALSTGLDLTNKPFDPAGFTLEILWMTSSMAPRTGKNEVGLKMDDRCLQDVGR